MRLAVCLLYDSVVERRLAVLRVCHSWHSLAVCSCSVVVAVVVVCRALVQTCVPSLCVVLVACVSVAVSLRCRVG
jgi:hypothetical protein